MNNLTERAQKWIATYAKPHITRDYRPEDEARDIMNALLRQTEAAPRGTDIRLSFATNFLSGWLEDEGEEVLRHWQVVRSAIEAQAAPSPLVVGPPDSSQGEPTCYVAEESLKRLRDGTYNFVSAYREKNVLFGVPLFTTPPPSSPQVAVADIQKSTVPDGYAIVPVEATKEMLAAALDQIYPTCSENDLQLAREAVMICLQSGKYALAGTLDSLAAGIGTFPQFWRSLVAAAPAALQSAPKAAEPTVENWRLAIYQWATDGAEGMENGAMYVTDLLEHSALDIAKLAPAEITAIIRGTAERAALLTTDDEPLFTVSMYGTAAAADKAREEWLAAKVEPQARHWREAIAREFYGPDADAGEIEDDFESVEQRARSLAQAEQAAK